MPPHPDLHAQALVIDGHADTPQRFVDEAWDFTAPLDGGMLNLASARAGNLTAAFFAIWPEPTQWRGRYAHRTLQLIDGVYQQLHKHPQHLRLGLTPDDILQSHADGTFCILLGLEGGHAIENDLALLRLYHRLGVRYMTLTWSNSNEWADSSGDTQIHNPDTQIQHPDTQIQNPDTQLQHPDDATIPHHGGLTPFGRDVVREMNRLGMMVDISHAADTTFWDVLQTTHAPIIGSHSSARALTDHPRNLTDQQLRAIATNNGLVMVNFYPAFIDDRWRTAWAATQPQRAPLYEAAAAPYLAASQPVPYHVSLAVDRAFYRDHLAADLPLAPLSTLINHIDHVAHTAGIDHVGLGSDFDGFPILPADLSSAADLPGITAALQQRGYTAEQLHKLLGGNLLRVFREVQDEATHE
jgi:membrane dipeptidase